MTRLHRLFAVAKFCTNQPSARWCLFDLRPTTARRCHRRNSAWLSLYFFVVASAGPCRLRPKWRQCFQRRSKANRSHKANTRRAPFRLIAASKSGHHSSAGWCPPHLRSTVHRHCRRGALNSGLFRLPAIARSCHRYWSRGCRRHRLQPKLPNRLVPIRCADDLRESASAPAFSSNWPAKGILLAELTCGTKGSSLY